ncbi:MAG: signal peptidase II [Oscillospiraceae bacterium]|nr:signal peptidase II [Oscillospiraceae bacterium]
MVTTAIAILLLVALDRASKVLATALLVGRGTVEILPGILGLYYLEGGNTGAAFGMFKGNTMILIVLTAVVVVLLIYCLFCRQFASKLMKIAAVLITAGGIGNLYDRIVYGYVTDFFRFLFIEFPIFNVADCLVCVGAALVVLSVLLSPKDAPLFTKKNDAADGNG